MSHQVKMRRQPQSLFNLEETYANTILGLTQKVRSGERKVLGVRWNSATDELVMDFEEIASAATGANQKSNCESCGEVL